MDIFYFRALIAIGLLASLGGGILAVKEWGASRERERVALATAQAEHDRYVEANAISVKLQAQLQQYQTDNQKLTEDLNAQIAKNGVYAACKLPADGVRLYNQALASAGAR